jgi:hypothetical protein
MTETGRTTEANRIAQRIADIDESLAAMRQELRLPVAPTEKPAIAGALHD